jgi:hypothetical protein
MGLVIPWKGWRAMVVGGGGMGMDDGQWTMDDLGAAAPRVFYLNFFGFGILGFYIVTCHLLLATSRVHARGWAFW